MKTGIHLAGSRRHLWLWIAVVALTPNAAPCARAQDTTGFAAEQPSRHSRHDKRAQPHAAPRSSQPPAFKIPTEPLGFTTPGPLYLGLRNSLASLDFLDEDRLLFTFRVPGLMRREEAEGEETERQIRALVLALPGGGVQAEALWTVHDRNRYLWMLKDGHFLLRDRDLIEEGDALLGLKPLLRFPGPVNWLELDPTQKYLVTNSWEPLTPGKAGGAEVSVGSKSVASSSTASASARLTLDGQGDDGQKNMVVRILRRDSGQVMLVSRARSAVHLPINGEGYVEDLRGNAGQWLLNLNYFSGGSRILGRVESACTPALDFIADREVVATACDREGAGKLVAVTSEGRELWEHTSAATQVWPILVRSPDGSRVAREVLFSDHSVNAFSPLDSADIKGQLVEVFDAGTGKVALTAMASPVLDAGGNVAISPSGRRVAVVDEGAIEVFELPATPALP